MLTGFIYVITNDINGKQYVGKTTDTLENRFSDHCKSYTLKHFKGRPLYMAMNKYGIEHFSIAQLEECPLNILSEREQYWIKKLNTYHKGYNATLGGEGTQIYDYDLFIQDFNNNLTIKEIAAKYSCNPTTVSKVLKKVGLDTTRALKNQNKSNAKKIYQYDLNGNFLQEFHSCWAAANWIIDTQNASYTTIGHIRCNIIDSAQNKNYRKTAYGYQWSLEKLDSKAPVQYLPQGNPIICVETQQIFDNATQAAHWCGLKSPSSILDYLRKRNNRVSAGKHPITKEKLHWKYYNSQENSN